MGPRFRLPAATRSAPQSTTRSSEPSRRSRLRRRRPPARAPSRHDRVSTKTPAATTFPRSTARRPGSSGASRHPTARPRRRRHDRPGRRPVRTTPRSDRRSSQPRSSRPQASCSTCERSAANRGGRSRSRSCARPQSTLPPHTRAPSDRTMSAGRSTHRRPAGAPPRRRCRDRSVTLARRRSRCRAGPSRPWVTLPPLQAPRSARMVRRFRSSVGTPPGSPPRRR